MQRAQPWKCSAGTLQLAVGGLQGVYSSCHDGCTVSKFTHRLSFSVHPCGEVRTRHHTRGQQCPSLPGKSEQHHPRALCTHRPAAPATCKGTAPSCTALLWCKHCDQGARVQHVLRETPLHAPCWHAAYIYAQCWPSQQPQRRPAGSSSRSCPAACLASCTACSSAAATPAGSATAWPCMLTLCQPATAAAPLRRMVTKCWYGDSVGPLAMASARAAPGPTLLMASPAPEPRLAMPMQLCAMRCANAPGRGMAAAAAASARPASPACGRCHSVAVKAFSAAGSRASTSGPPPTGANPKTACCTGACTTEPPAKSAPAAEA